MSDALTVFLPACFATFIASSDISVPISSSTFVSSTYASSLMRSAPAFLISLPTGATGNSLIIFPPPYAYILIFY